MLTLASPQLGARFGTSIRPPRGAIRVDRGTQSPPTIRVRV